MNTERGVRIKELFHAALELDADQRRGFVEASCGTDDALLAEIESLLDWDARADQRIDHIEDAIASVATGADHEPIADEGRRIGAYRVLRKIGQGGLGTVFLAERADQQYRKKVAIKIIRRDRINQEVVRRFRQERQILAHLDHPLIARLHDGGATDDDLPYVVMEYIEGEPIDAYCDRHKLSISSRLELFRQVCSAVHHAHQNLIIHRDIKPSNILVTQDGTPKLLDFGIAKLLDTGLDSDLGPHTLVETLGSASPLTPQYASPEQIRGDLLTTATDVYSLGVLLYRLLTGHSPYRFPSSRTQDVEKVICDADPERPSAAVGRVETARDGGDTEHPLTPQLISEARQATPQRLQRRLAGDLDNIVLMAMRKEPERRYPSAEQLAEDLRRHGARLPVVAQPDTSWYRTRKFVDRNRLRLVAVAGVVLLLAGLVGVYTQLLRQERDRATVQADTKTEVVKFVTGLFAELDPDLTQGEPFSALDLLDRGSARVREQLAGRPEVHADVMYEFGKIYKNLRDFEKAEPLLVESLAIRRRHFGPRHDAVADSLYELGEVQFQLAQVRNQPHKIESATRHFREAMQIRVALLGESHRSTLLSLNALAVVERSQGRNQEAERLYLEVLAKQRQILAPGHLDLTTTLQNLGVVLVRMERYPEALERFQEAMDIKLEKLGRNHQQTAILLGNVANLHLRRGDYSAAAEGFSDVRDILRRLLGDRHVDVARATFRLGEARAALNDLHAAETLYLEATNILKSIDPTDARISRWQQALVEVRAERVTSHRP